MRFAIGISIAAAAIGAGALFAGTGAAAVESNAGATTAAPATRAPADTIFASPVLRCDEHVLDRLTTDVTLTDVMASPDARHCACVERRGELGSVTYDVSLDGRPGPSVKWIVGETLLFSPDSRRLSWQTEDAGGIHVVVESVAKLLNPPAAAPDSRGAAADPRSATTSATQAAGAEIEGVSRGYWMAGHVQFSPNSQHVCYSAQIEKGRFVMVADGQIGPVCDGIDDGETVYSPDGKRLAYRALLAGRQRIVLDGTPGPDYDAVYGAVFSGDSRRFGYRVHEGKEEFCVIDGRPGPHFALVAGLTFSRDGRRVACAVGKEGEQMLVVDGKSYQPFEGLTAILFSPDSRRIAIAAVEKAPSGNAPDGSPSPPRQKYVAVFDGKPSAPYDAVAALRFSPDSKRTAFVALRGRQQLVVIDGKESPGFDGIALLTFSPDSRHVAYIAGEGPQRDLFVDGVRLGPSGAYAFSPDSRHIARTVPVAEPNLGRSSLAFDNTTTRTVYDGFPLGSQIVFDDPQTARLVCGHGKEMYMVTLHAD